jgi:2-polyprenyl-3-methyl-5-hydroxy-6-metoxy-1,4-benzoquinol methylase
VSSAGPGPEPPDVETSSERYARRFAGPVGEFLLETQARVTLSLLRSDPGARALEVGGGHAQLASPLVDAGIDLTILGSTPACAERLRPLLDAGRVAFRAGDLLAAPFADRSFDVVLAFRLLPHVERWQDLVRELCRLARRAVIVDYPTRRSVNAIAGPLFGLKKGVEGDTRTFRVFGEREVREAFFANGFRSAARRPEFLFPMALHRALGSAAAARAIEGLAAATGLVRALGSPVILRAERRER